MAAGSARSRVVAAGSARSRAVSARSALGGHAGSGTSSSSFGRRQSYEEGDKHTPPADLAHHACEADRSKAARGV